MAQPSYLPVFASDATYTAGDNVGEATKVDAGASYYAQGFVSGLPFIGDYWNYFLNGVCAWLSYLKNLKDEAFAWTAAHTFGSTVGITGLLTASGGVSTTAVTASSGVTTSTLTASGAVTFSSATSPTLTNASTEITYQGAGRSRTVRIPLTLGYNPGGWTLNGLGLQSSPDTHGDVWAPIPPGTFPGGCVITGLLAYAQDDSAGTVTIALKEQVYSPATNGTATNTIASLTTDGTGHLQGPLTSDGGSPFLIQSGLNYGVSNQYNVYYLLITNTNTSPVNLVLTVEVSYTETRATGKF
jgi:hypothetical protein